MSTPAECPGCGRKLPESAEVTDGQPLGCGCDGQWSVDSETCEPSHDDECRQCELEEARESLAWRLLVWAPSTSPDELVQALERFITATVRRAKS